ncbi:hypothetical protein SCT_1408 [Sulfuricella sp. T08]|uniref:hypothetical protein n=1 Tax=Sulfuricella sp. T08 TaxID=1632857 RepID=UPI0006179EDD|nr:hypothetical protein [Sulfuricella sp. T08]GAO36011.1 hypothetical protein SCT_1408 [Sulfuricella sp. T08]
MLVSSLAFYGPGLLAPAAWDKNATYLLIYNLYQGVLVVAWFWFGPAICRALVVEKVVAGPLRQAVDHTLAGLHKSKGQIQLTEIPVILAKYSAPFIVTAGLLPGQSQVFISSALAEQLGVNGLRFLLARALVHGNLSQRLASLLPVLVLTVMFPDTPWDAMTWLGSAGFLVCWLAIHWFFELCADRQAALALGLGAEEGLREVLVANASPVGWLSVQPPIRWRLHMVAGG